MHYSRRALKITRVVVVVYDALNHMRDLFRGEAKIAVFWSLLRVFERKFPPHKSTDFDETFGDPKEKEKEYDDDENLSQAWWRVFHRATLLVGSQNYHDRSESASE